MNRLRECSLYKPVCGYARRRSFRWQVAELQFFEHRIDFYAFSRIHNATLAVELKLTNWQRAIQQALIYQLCADYVWIALPDYTVPRIDKAMLIENGIGLLSVDRHTLRCQIVIEPVWSQVVRPYYRDECVSHVLRSD